MSFQISFSEFAVSETIIIKSVAVRSEQWRQCNDQGSLQTAYLFRSIRHWYLTKSYSGIKAQRVIVAPRFRKSKFSQLHPCELEIAIFLLKADSFPILSNAI